MTVTDIPAAATPAAAPPEGRAAARRAAYIAGGRALMDALEANPQVPLPDAGRISPVTFHFLAGDDPRAAMAATARALGGRWRKQTRDYADVGGGSYFDLAGALLGLKIQLTAARGDVCERVVTGVREVTEIVPDPELLAAVPLIEVTRPVEEVRWVCGPLMASAADAEPDAE